MDHQTYLLLRKLQANNGKLLVRETEVDKYFDPVAVDRASRFKLITFVSNGGFGAHEGYELTRKGWMELGLEPPPSLVQRLWRLFRRTS
jgi:hypothetical protein